MISYNRYLALIDSNLTRQNLFKYTSRTPFSTSKMGLSEKSIPLASDEIPNSDSKAQNSPQSSKIRHQVNLKNSYVGVWNLLERTSQSTEILKKAYYDQRLLSWGEYKNYQSLRRDTKLTARFVLLPVALSLVSGWWTLAFIVPTWPAFWQAFPSSMKRSMIPSYAFDDNDMMRLDPYTTINSLKLVKDIKFKDAEAVLRKFYHIYSSVDKNDVSKSPIESEGTKMWSILNRRLKSQELPSHQAASKILLTVAKNHEFLGAHVKFSEFKFSEIRSSLRIMNLGSVNSIWRKLAVAKMIQHSIQCINIAQYIKSSPDAVEMDDVVFILQHQAGMPKEVIQSWGPDELEHVFNAYLLFCETLYRFNYEHNEVLGNGSQLEDAGRLQYEYRRQNLGAKSPLADPKYIYPEKITLSSILLSKSLLASYFHARQLPTT